MIRKFQNHTPQIPDSCYIFPTATIIGDVVLGENVIAYPGVVIRGERHKVVIGDNTNLQENSTIHMEWDRDCIIGSGVTIGHNAIIHACTICDNVLVGMGAIVQDGAVIGENSFIGAGALIPRKMIVPPAAWSTVSLPVLYAPLRRQSTKKSGNLPQSISSTNKIWKHRMQP